MSHLEEDFRGVPGKTPTSTGETASEFEDSFLRMLAQPPSGTAPYQGPRPGERLGGHDGQRFELLDELGRGGMGQVFRAYDTLLQRIVALKFIATHKPCREESLGPLLQEEARLVALLNHENIVRIFDISEWRGWPFLVMEYLEGQSLSALLSQGPLALPRALRFVEGVTAGLSHAHAHGVIHRDLKPSNVLVLTDDWVKLLDFGIARFVSSLTDDPIRSGTPGYMAPEQWRGAPQDARTDIWGAGLLLYRMLTGGLPYPTQDTEELGRRIMSPEPIPLIRTLRPDLPRQVERLLARALAKEPSRRFQSALELREALLALERDLALPSPESHPPRLTHRRQVTLVSCRLSGNSTSLDPEDLGELHAAFHEACSRIIARQGGQSALRVGNEVLACYGCPQVREDDLLRAVHAALALTQVATQLPQALLTEPAVRVGVHTDVVVLEAPSVPGPPSALTIQGRAPQLASWLAGLAAPGAVVLSENTYRGVRMAFETQSVGPQRFETELGALQVGVHRLIRERPEATRFDRALASGLTPLMGRTLELERLRSAWNSARQGTGAMVLLSGEAGMGKSRLVQELREHVTRDDGLHATGQCWPQLGGSAFHPIIELLEHLLQFEQKRPPQRLRLLEELLGAPGPGSTEEVLLLAQLFGLPPPEGARPLFPNPERQRERTLEVLTTLLLRLPHRCPDRGAPCPLLLVVEDLHWADISTHRLLTLLHQRMGTTGLCLVLSARPEFQPDWPPRAGFQWLVLDRLPTQATDDMVRHLTRGRSLPRETLTYLVQKTEGIPLFIEEMTRALLERAPGPGQSPLEEPLPVTLHELLLARLDPLPPEQKELAWMGSVFGRGFTQAQLMALSGRDGTLLRRDLEELVEAGILRPDGRDLASRYEFRHALIQEAAYQSLLRSQRREYHRRIAGLLAAPPEGVDAATPELVAHHYTQAGELEQAITWWTRAGELALRRSAHADAVTHYARALKLLESLPDNPQRARQELALRLAYGAPLMSTYGYAAPVVRDTYARARELCRLAGDDAQLFPALLGLWQFYMVRGETRASSELGHRLLAQAERAQEPTLLMLARRALGSSQMLHGELKVARELTEQGLSLYDREKHGKLALRFGQDPGVTNGLYLGWSLWLLGYPDQALKQTQQALALARALEHPLSIAFALVYVASIRNLRGEYAAARECAEEATVISTEHRLALWLAYSKIQRGGAILLGSGRREGAGLLEEGISDWRKTGADSGLTYFLSVLVQGQCRAGDLERARKTLEQVEGFAASNDEHFFDAENWRLRGEVALASDPGHPGPAEDCFHRGLEVARRQQAKSWELRLGTSLGGLLAKQGRATEARRLLRPLYAWFTEGLETLDLRAARELLTRLG